MLHVVFAVLNLCHATCKIKELLSSKNSAEKIKMIFVVKIIRLKSKKLSQASSNITAPLNVKVQEKISRDLSGKNDDCPYYTEINTECHDWKTKIKRFYVYCPMGI